jgi:hypothetical protein
MIKWEYEIREINPRWESKSAGGVPDGVEIIEGFLDGMGDLGWELVGFIPTPQTEEAKAPPVNPYVFHAVFKRPKEGN